MKRLGLRTKLLTVMFLVITASIGLLTFQAVVLFQEDKSLYIFDLNASRAIKISDEIRANVQHLTEKMRIFAQVIRMEPPAGTDRREVLLSLLQQYPEFLLYSLREPGGSFENIFFSQLLSELDLNVDAIHKAYESEGGLTFEGLTAEKPQISRLHLSSELPTFTLAVLGMARREGEPPDILVAEIPLDRFFAGQGESRLFEIYVTDGGGTPLVSVGGAGEGSAVSRFTDLLPSTALAAGTREYESAGTPMLAAYSSVGNLGLWTIVQIPKARAFEAAQRLVTQSLVTAGVVGIVALCITFLFAAGITRSLTVLTRATEQIGRGQFKVEIPVKSGGEIGALAKRFERMARELRSREQALNEANRMLVQSEKMTALGQLGAGIAHEVKNPMTSIRGYAQMGLRKVTPESPLHGYFETIEKETARSLEILKNLLRFSRQETAEMSPIDLNVVVGDVLKLVTHQLEMKGVKVDSHLCEEEFQIQGNANQLEQVLLNLMMNAGDAMEETGGRVKVTTEFHKDRFARIKIADTGCGIPEKVKNKIFDPSFTTKPVGKGTGLGLSVSYGIIKDHHGDIFVDSQPGAGTTFSITLPVIQEPAQAPVGPSSGGEKKNERVISLR